MILPEFADIQQHWAEPCISQLASEKLVSGYPGGDFRPGSPVTRAEFAVLMANAFPEAEVIQPPRKFADVPPSHWAYKAIKNASEKGFFAGYPDGTFKPNQSIPRVQAIIVLAAHLKLRVPPDPLQLLSNNFIDASDIPAYARNMMAAATIGAIVVNYPAQPQLQPLQIATRGEVAALFCRALNIYAVPPQYIAGVQVRPQSVRPLPGGLDRVPTFNSNSPELVRTGGILLSTFPRSGKAVPAAHLNFPFEGRFDIFSHHIVRAETSVRSFYQGIILHNPGQKAVTVRVLQGASYLSNPDAPYIQLPDRVDNGDGKVYAGPGSRTMTEVLRGVRQDIFPPEMAIGPGKSAMLMNQPLPIYGIPSSNGRTTMMRLSSDGPIYVANLIMNAPFTARGTQRKPSLKEWLALLNNGGFAGPRDRAPTPLDREGIEPTVFSRVAGVSQGSEWQGKITDRPESEYLTIPGVGGEFAYVLSSIHKITLGTGQIQSAPMLLRYPDTAYFAHANYGIEYSLTLPLYNNTEETKTVTISFASPLKDSEPNDQLLFLRMRDRVFFRGTVRVKTEDGTLRYLHIVQRRGQEGVALATVKIPPSQSKRVEIELIYPPDCTPPQAITVRTVDR